MGSSTLPYTLSNVTNALEPHHSANIAFQAYGHPRHSWYAHALKSTCSENLVSPLQCMYESVLESTVVQTLDG